MNSWVRTMRRCRQDGRVIIKKIKKTHKQKLSVVQENLRNFLEQNGAARPQHALTLVSKDKYSPKTKRILAMNSLDKNVRILKDEWKNQTLREKLISSLYTYSRALTSALG